MILYDYSQKTVAEAAELPDSCKDSGELFAVCKTHEVAKLRDAFGFDESTVRECTDLDESVRYSSYDGYDFISMVHIEVSDDRFTLREINLYISGRYLILILPEHDSPRLSEMEHRLFFYAGHLKEKGGSLASLYFWIFNSLLADFSDTLENLEDRMQELSEEIVANVSKTQFARVSILRNMAFVAKKHLRALSYLGEQILLDENRLLDKKYTPHFRSVGTRFKKLYDFAESLYSLGGELLSIYDSRLSMKTNDMVNKLTVVTLFFGPLTVITGIYGMNFAHMPELDLPFGYPMALGVMAAVSLILFIVMKIKKWL